MTHAGPWCAASPIVAIGWTDFHATAAVRATQIKRARFIVAPSPAVGATLTIDLRDRRCESLTAADAVAPNARHWTGCRAEVLAVRRRTSLQGDKCNSGRRRS